MKKAFILVIISAILFSSMRGTVTIVDFYLNQDFFAQELCVNRLKPALMCSGKCVLISELEKHNAETQNSDQLQVDRNFELFHRHGQPDFISCNVSIFSKDDIYVPKSGRLFHSGVYKRIFHPPQYKDNNQVNS